MLNIFSDRSILVVFPVWDCFLAHTTPIQNFEDVVGPVIAQKWVAKVARSWAHYYMQFIDFFGLQGYSTLILMISIGLFFYRYKYFRIDFKANTHWWLCFIAFFLMFSTHLLFTWIVFEYAYCTPPAHWAAKAQAKCLFQFTIWVLLWSRILGEFALSIEFRRTRWIFVLILFVSWLTINHYLFWEWDINPATLVHSWLVAKNFLFLITVYELVLMVWTTAQQRYYPDRFNWTPNLEKYATFRAGPEKAAAKPTYDFSSVPSGPSNLWKRRMVDTDDLPYDNWWSVRLWHGVKGAPATEVKWAFLKTIFRAQDHGMPDQSRVSALAALVDNHFQAKNKQFLNEDLQTYKEAKGLGANSFNRVDARAFESILQAWGDLEDEDPLDDNEAPLITRKAKFLADYYVKNGLYPRTPSIYVDEGRNLLKLRPFPSYHPRQIEINKYLNLNTLYFRSHIDLGFDYFWAPIFKTLQRQCKFLIADTTELGREEVYDHIFTDKDVSAAEACHDAWVNDRRAWQVRFTKPFFSPSAFFINKRGVQQYFPERLIFSLSVEDEREWRSSPEYWSWRNSNFVEWFNCLALHRPTTYLVTSNAVTHNTEPAWWQAFWGYYNYVPFIRQAYVQHTPSAAVTRYCVSPRRSGHFFPGDSFVINRNRRPAIWGLLTEQPSKEWKAWMKFCLTYDLNPYFFKKEPHPIMEMLKDPKRAE